MMINPVAKRSKAGSCDLLQSSLGVTLVELLVSMALFIVFLLVVVGLTKYQSDLLSQILKDNAIQEAMREMSLILAKEENCTRSLSSAQINTTEIGIYRKIGGDYIERFSSANENNMIGNNIKITGIKAKKLASNPVGDDERGPFEVVVTFVNQRASIVTKTTTKKILVIGKLSNGVIQDCIANDIEQVDNAALEICRDDLSGEMITDPTDGNLCIKVGGAKYMLIKETICETLGGTFGGDGKCDTVDIAGNITVDSTIVNSATIENTLNTETLNLQGGVTIGYTSTGVPGTIRFKNGKPELFNGSVWGSLGSGTSLPGICTWQNTPMNARCPHGYYMSGIKGIGGSNQTRCCPFPQ